MSSNLKLACQMATLVAPWLRSLFWSLHKLEIIYSYDRVQTFHLDSESRVGSRTPRLFFWLARARNTNVKKKLGYLHTQLLVLLVNDSEYNQSAGAKPILSHSCIYLVYPGAAAALHPPNLEAEPLGNGGSSLPGSASSFALIIAPFFGKKKFLWGKKRSWRTRRLDTRFLVTKSHRGFRSSKFEELKANKLFSRFVTKKQCPKRSPQWYQDLFWILASVQSTSHLVKYFVLKYIYRDRSFRA